MRKAILFKMAFLILFKFNFKWLPNINLLVFSIQDTVD